MHGTYISLFLCTCVAIATAEWEECSNQPKCRCSHGEITWRRTGLLCYNITLDELLNLECNSNITVLVMYDSIFNNVSQQESRTTSKCAVERIRFQRATINMFSWKWMPKSLTTLSISMSTIHKFYGDDITQDNDDLKHKCYIDHLKALRVLSVRGWRTSSILHCIPSSIEFLQIDSVNLQQAAMMFHAQQYWPDSLNYLQLRNNSISRISHNFFACLPKNLTKFFIDDQPGLNETSFLMYLPTSSLSSLALSNLSIIDIPSMHLTNLSNANMLESLRIDHTLLKRIPYKLPSSLLKLRLNDNKITELDTNVLTYLTRLKYLDLSRNLLRALPNAFPESLEELYLDHNNIRILSSDTFTRLARLKILFITNNRLEGMPQGIQPGIFSYQIDGNLITDIGPSMYYDFCSSCKSFSIERNPWDCNENMVKFLVWNKDIRNISAITSTKDAICSDGFSALYDRTLNQLINEVLKYAKLNCDYNITHLRCNNTEMKSMPKLSTDLHDVQIINSEEIGVIPDNAFDGMTELKRLWLQNIGLRKIPTRLPESLIYLNLAFNKIKELSVDVQRAMEKMKALQYLDMRYNELHTFPVRSVRSLHKLQWVHLKGNPLDCECDLWPFVKWVNGRRKLVESNTEGFFGQCSSPVSKRETDIRTLSTYFTYEKVCVPPQCGWDGTSAVINCSYAMQEKRVNTGPEMHTIPTIPSNSYWKIMDLSSLHLNAADINLTHLTELDAVILFNNSLDTLPIEGFPKSLKIIDVGNNNISELPHRDELQQHFDAIDCIDLRNNNIRTLSEEDVGYFQHLSSLKLEGNPFICDCKIRPLVSWISANHDIPSAKDHDFQTLICHEPNEIKGELIATLDYDNYCPSIKIPAVIGGLVAGVMVLLVIFFCSLGYYRKRGKIKERESILQGFRDLLQQEAEYKDTDPETGITDNSKIKYDAFISYSTHDEDADFAAMLSDELEMKHSYKLCIHERDFLPGMGIADNIVECIGASKRIILILSQHFLSSPWCQYEVQIALTELHQKRKSKLLIPILLEDLDENIEGSVKTFLSLIKAIKIPDDDSHTSWKFFWEELLHSMPDERVSDIAR